MLGLNQRAISLDAPLDRAMAEEPFKLGDLPHGPISTCKSNGLQRFGKEASTDFVSGGPFKMGISYFYFFDRTFK